MSRSLIQTSNQSSQTVALNSVIAPGTTIRRFGCNLRLSGNGIEVDGAGYYTFDATVTVAPTAAGTVTVALYKDGVQIPGAVASSVGTAGDPVTLPIVTTIRQGCECDGASNVTLVLTAGPGTVSNVSLRAERA
jgi:hypothetical protein